MSRTPELNARESLRRELLEHEQRLRQFIGQAFGESRTDKTASSARPVLAASLTPRDIEILGLLVLGQTNRQIGLQVRLGPGTVRNRLSRIFRKLGVNSRTEAAVRALELGLVRADNTQ